MKNETPQTEVQGAKVVQTTQAQIAPTLPKSQEFCRDCRHYCDTGKPTAAYIRACTLFVEVTA